MTALEKYDRLEAIGIWQETKEAPPREVVVSFGDASLQLTGGNDTPLTHWALLATRAVGTKGEATIWSPDPEHAETLAITDPEMNRAIRAITAELEDLPTKPPVLRWVVRLVGILLLVALISRAPPYIAGWAAMLTSPIRAEAISEQMVADLVSENGKACRNWQSARDLEGLLETTFGQPPEVRVFRLDEPALFALPDGTIIVSRNALDRPPAQVMARLALAMAGVKRHAGLEQALLDLGPLAGLEYLVTGGRRANPKVSWMMDTSPDGTDYVVARNLLAEGRWPTGGLQEMAAQDGIGLSVDDAQPAPPLDSADPVWQSILQICTN